MDEEKQTVTEETADAQLEAVTPEEMPAETAEPQEKSSRFVGLFALAAGILYVLTALSFAGNELYWFFAYKVEIPLNSYFLFGVYVLLAASFFLFRKLRFLPICASCAHVICYLVTFIPELGRYAQESGMGSAEFREYLIYCLFTLLPYVVLAALAAKGLKSTLSPRAIRYLPALIFFTHMLYCRNSWGYFSSGFQYTVYMLFDLLESAALLCAGAAIVDFDFSPAREKHTLLARTGGTLLALLALANLIMYGNTYQLTTYLYIALTLLLGLAGIRAVKDELFAVAAGVNAVYYLYELVNRLTTDLGMKLFAVLNVLAYCALLFLALTRIVPGMKDKKYLREGMWFLPGAFYGIAALYQWLAGNYFETVGAVWPYMLISLAEVAALLLFGVWLRDDEPEEAAEAGDASGAPVEDAPTDAEPEAAPADTPETASTDASGTQE